MGDWHSRVFRCVRGDCFEYFAEFSGFKSSLRGGLLLQIFGFELMD